MKDYEIALKELPEKMGTKIFRDEIISEVQYGLEEQNDFQAGAHMLKAARECLFKWCKHEDFSDKVFERIKTVNYDDLDLFQRAVIHILSVTPYKDNCFDISQSSVDYFCLPKDWNKGI